MVTRVSSAGNFFFHFQYLFVDTRHKLIFSTRDDCLSFLRSSVLFKPDELSFHSTSSDVVLSYDESAKKVLFILDA